jgi:hypothetical protein
LTLDFSHTRSMCPMAIELKQVSLVTFTDPEVQNGYKEVLSPYFHDCRIRTEL